MVNWLPVAVLGLTFAVLVLGLTVMMMVVRNRPRQSPPVGDRTRQEHLDSSGGGSTRANEPGPFLPMPQVGFPNPRRTFYDAFRNGDTQSAVAILPELARKLGSKHPEYLASAGALAAVGEPDGLQPLLDAVDSDDISDESILQIVLMGTVQYYVSIDREQEGLNKMKEVLDRHIHDESRTRKFRSCMANQLQMLYLGAGETDNALSSVNLAIELLPEEHSYYFNLSIIHERQENLEQAVQAIERCMEMKGDPPDRDHLYQAGDLYRQTGDEKKMKAMQERLGTGGGVR